MIADEAVSLAERAPLAEPDVLPTLCCLFAAAVLLGAGYGIWDNIAADLHLVALFSSLLCYVAAFALIVIGFTRSRHATVAVVAGVSLAFTVYASSYILFKVPYYDSDAMLFNSYSAQLFLQGVDPYTQSMQPGYRVFGVPEGETTPTLNGGEVYSLSYPALSFLVYIPFLALGLSNLLWVSVGAHLLIMLMLVWMAPARLKALAPFMLFLDATYFDYTVGGITDVLWLPAGLLAAFYWRRNPVAAAAWLGVASAFKQTPWIIVPFALIFWLRQALASRRGVDFAVPVATLVGTFLVPNLPFILWHPRAWIAGTLTPLSAHLIVLGTGVAQLATSGVLSLSTATFTEMTLVSVAAVLTLYVLFPKRLAFLPFFAPALVFFFSSRSLHNYFMYWPLVLMAYLFANGREYFEESRGERLRFTKMQLAAVLTLGALTGIPLVARSSSRPVSVTINGAARDPTTGRIARLRILVRNASNVPKYFHFDVAEQGEDVDVQAWEPRSLQFVAPRATQTFDISSPSPEFELRTDGNTATQTFAIDAQGQEYYSRPIVFGAPSPTIHNANLTYWSLGSRPFPISWAFDEADWTSGRLAKSVVAGRSAVSLRASAGVDSQTTVLEQVTDARPALLRFMLYPTVDYTDGAHPRALFGIELRDVVGKSVYYTVDSRRDMRATYVTQQGIINVLPGRLRTWNTIDVDVARLRRETGFVLSPSATMVVGAVAVTRDPRARALVGYFGGMKVVGGNVELDRRLRAEGVATLPSVGANEPRLGSRPPTRLRYLDDGEPGIAYVGRWQHLHGRRDGRSAGTSTRSRSAGDRAELHFDGSGFRVFGVLGPGGGRATALIDGKRLGEMGFYARTKRTSALVFRANVARGPHDLVIVVAQSPSEARRRAYVNLDGISIVP